MSAAIVAEVGKFYMVPCVKVEDSARTMWMNVNGWVPIFGPKHTDAEHLEFTYPHWHIDWRFVGQTQYRYAQRTRSGEVLARVLMNDTGTSREPKLTNTPELRRLKCKREMPVFPVVSAIVVLERSGTKWERLERAQAVTCNKLKPGNICPHRGIDLTPFVKADGTVVCPGHGLRWDTRTGDLLPYQASAA